MEDSPEAKFLKEFNRENSSNEGDSNYFRSGYTHGSTVCTSTDVESQVLDWALTYLEQRKCPYNLAFSLAKTVSQELGKTMESHCQGRTNGNNTDFSAEKLHSDTISHIHNLCENNPPEDLISPQMMDCPFVTSVCAVKNQRRKMEDRHVVHPDLNSQLPEGAPHYCYYAVFDGHAGTDSASYVSTYLHQNIASHPEFLTDPAKAIREGFLMTDNNLLEKLGNFSPPLKSGSTALCAILCEKELYLAWLGDSQALLVKQGSPKIIMSPHKPDRQDEKERIEDAGGLVLFYGTWRVNGILAVSRAFGDLEHKPVITSEPDIVKVDLDGTEDLLVLACDGLWDRMTMEDVVATMKSYLVNEKGSPDKTAEKLVEDARARGSQDNITVIVVFLRNPADVISTLATSPIPFPMAVNGSGTNGHQTPLFPMDTSNPLGNLPTPPIDDLLLPNFEGDSNKQISDVQKQLFLDVPQEDIQQSSESQMPREDQEATGLDDEQEITAAMVNKLASEIVSKTMDLAVSRINPQETDTAPEQEINGSLEQEQPPQAALIQTEEVNGSLEQEEQVIPPILMQTDEINGSLEQEEDEELVDGAAENLTNCHNFAETEYPTITKLNPFEDTPLAPVEDIQPSTNPFFESSEQTNVLEPSLPEQPQIPETTSESQLVQDIEVMGSPKEEVAASCGLSEMEIKENEINARISSGEVLFKQEDEVKENLLQDELSSNPNVEELPKEPEETVPLTEESSPKVEELPIEPEKSAPVEESSPKVEDLPKEPEETMALTEETSYKVEELPKEQEEKSAPAEESSPKVEESHKEAEETLALTEESSPKVEELPKEPEETVVLTEETSYKFEELLKEQEEKPAEESFPKFEELPKEPEETVVLTEETSYKFEELLKEQEEKPAEESLPKFEELPKEAEAIAQAEESALKFEELTKEPEETIIPAEENTPKAEEMPEEIVLIEENVPIVEETPKEPEETLAEVKTSIEESSTLLQDPIHEIPEPSVAAVPQNLPENPFSLKEEELEQVDLDEIPAPVIEELPQEIASIDSESITKESMEAVAEENNTSMEVHPDLLPATLTETTGEIAPQPLLPLEIPEAGAQPLSYEQSTCYTPFEESTSAESLRSEINEDPDKNLESEKSPDPDATPLASPPLEQKPKEEAKDELILTQPLIPSLECLGEELRPNVQDLVNLNAAESEHPSVPVVIPEGVPEAEGVTEDSGSEKDEGWQYQTGDEVKKEEPPQPLIDATPSMPPPVKETKAKDKTALAKKPLKDDKTLLNKSQTAPRSALNKPTSNLQALATKKPIAASATQARKTPTSATKSTVPATKPTTKPTTASTTKPSPAPSRYAYKPPNTNTTSKPTPNTSRLNTSTRPAADTKPSRAPPASKPTASTTKTELPKTTRRPPTTTNPPPKTTIPPAKTTAAPKTASATTNRVNLSRTNTTTRPTTGTLPKTTDLAAKTTNVTKTTTSTISRTTNYTRNTTTRPITQPKTAEPPTKNTNTTKTAASTANRPNYLRTATRPTTTAPPKTATNAPPKTTTNLSKTKPPPRTADPRTNKRPPATNKPGTNKPTSANKTEPKPVPKKPSVKPEAPIVDIPLAENGPDKMVEAPEQAAADPTLNEQVSEKPAAAEVETQDLEEI